MKKFKIFALVGMMTLAMLSMTACNGANSEDTATTTSEPYIDAYEEDVDVKDIYSATDANGNPVTTTSPSEDGEDETTDSSNSTTTTKPSGGGSGNGGVNPNYITNTNQTHDDGAEFHIIKFNGVEYDITEMTGQDAYDIMGVEPDFRKKSEGTVEEDGFEYCFFKFGKSLNCYFEFLDENGNLYKHTEAGVWDYKDKQVQGVMFNDDENIDFVVFAQGIKLGMEREEVETILGRGYTLPDGTVAYKTPSVTFVVAYKTIDLVAEIDGKTEMTYISRIYVVCNE